MKRGATKEEIIRITQELITRNGIRAVRVDEIAQTLGISKRTLYEMFADKEDLVSACLDFMCHQQQERITAYRKRRSRSSLQRAFKLVYEYIEHLYTVESSFLSGKIKVRLEGDANSPARVYTKDEIKILGQPRRREQKEPVDDELKKLEDK